MIRSNTGKMSACAAVALAMCLATGAKAQYMSVPGNPPGSHNTVTGNGPFLGSLITGDPYLSTGGFDQITLNIGSIVNDTSNNGAAIAIFTSGNMVTNNGTINASISSGFFFAGTGLGFGSDVVSLSGETVVNNGAIFGANATSNNFSAGTGVAFLSDQSISSISLLNNGTIAAGNSGGGGGGFSGSGDEGVSILADGSVSNIVIVNNGSILGGTDTTNADFIGNGLTIVSYGNSGVAPVIDGVSVTNTGLIQGGGFNTSSNSNLATSTGIAIVGLVPVNNITVVNTATGTILGGSTNIFNGFGGPIPLFEGTGLAIGSAGSFNPADYNNNGYTDLTNVLILNAGNITGGSGNQGAADIGSAVALLATGNITGVNIQNSGIMLGGGTNAFPSSPFPLAFAFSAGNGITILAMGDSSYFYLGSPGPAVASTPANVTDVSINNSGFITGGDASIGGGPIYSQLYGNGIAISAFNAVSSISIMNTGHITGGDSSFDGSFVGNGIGINAGGPGSSASLDKVAITNTGLIRGGNNNDTGGGPFDTLYGNGIAIDGFSGVTNIFITNSGSIIGGDGNTNAGFDSNGIVINSGNSLGNVVITNTGLIQGGNNGNGGWDNNGVVITADQDINVFTLNNFGKIIGGNDPSNTGWAVAVNTNNGDINNVTINNFGLIAGGVGGDGVGLDIEAGNNINNLVLWNTGSILGGNGSSSDAAPAVYIDASQMFNNAVLTNMGLIRGGDGGGNFGTGGDGMHLLENLGGSLTVNNWGTVSGGNGATSGNAGIGIYYGGDNAVINNWGAISAGNGLTNAAQAGFPPVAISLQGNNNTINLNGHSSVNGTLEGNGTGNLLNLKFTGVSPQELATIKAQLALQGWPGSNNFTGFFTLRGVTYFVDPIPLNIQGITSYEGQAKTPNQFAVGANLDSITYNPAPGTPLFKLFNAIDASGNVPQALEELSPQKFEIYGELAIANATQMTLEIDQRLNNLRDGSESIDTTGMGGGSDQTTTAGYSKDDSKESKNVVQTAAPEKRWGFFASASGLQFRGNVKDVDLQQGKSDNAGTIAGVDGKVGEHAVIGALFAYNNADATIGSNNSHAVIDSYSGGIYGSYHQDGFYVNSLAAYTRNDYTNTRNLLFPGFGGTASSKTNGNQASVNIDGGYDFHATDRLTVGPLAGLQYVHLDVDGFNESGATAANLAVGSQSVDSLQSRIGVRADYHLQLKQDVAFATELSAAWQHEYLDDSRNISSSFIGAGLAPFSVRTASPQRDAGVVSLGINFTFHNKLTLFADYSLLMWNASYYEQTLNGGLRISF